MWALRKVSAVIALFVVLVCGQALADGERGFSDTDKPVVVSVGQKKVSTSLIGRCSTTKTSFNVRIQSIKSKTTSFSRVLMNMTDIETYASKLGNGTAKHIGGCAEMADKGGFAGFSFIKGLCKMFSPGRQPCRCDAGTGDLIYVRDSFWDKQGRAMRKLIPVGQDLLEYVNYPSTVFDQVVKMDAFWKIRSPMTPKTDAEIIPYLSPGSGLSIMLTRGNEWFYTTVVDTEHCSMGCNSSSSNFIVRRLFLYQQQLIDEITPQRFFLSECGNTIVVNSASIRSFLMSHEGYGCQWYTKKAEDNECTVTLQNATAKAMSVVIIAMRLDGDTKTCEGDSVAFYSGTPAAGTLLGNVTTCNYKTAPALTIPAGNVVVVFKRSSKQHQAEGFNFGFLLQLMKY